MHSVAMTFSSAVDKKLQCDILKTGKNKLTKLKKDKIIQQLLEVIGTKASTQSNNNHSQKIKYEESPVESSSIQ